MSALQGQNPQVRTAHSHPGDRLAIDAEKMRAAMKSQALRTDISPAQIVDEILATSAPGVRQRMASKESVKRMIRRHRNALAQRQLAVEVSAMLFDGNRDCALF